MYSQKKLLRIFFSFWGKFGQRENFKQSQIIAHVAEFLRFLSSTEKEIVDWHILSPDLVQVDWKYKKEFLSENQLTNVFLAAFTTAHARLRLYEILDQLGERVLYFDTDSVIYITKEGEGEPPLGDFLGDLTDELKGRHIVEFVSAGPKNYSYLLNDGDSCCKVKGFTLNHQNAQRINFSTMCSEVFLWYFHGVSSGASLENPRKICRDPKKQIIFNRVENKNYSLVYDKRRMVDNFDTLPYGYAKK